MTSLRFAPRLAVTATACVAALPALAQSPVAANQALEKITVTGTRTPQRIDEALADVVVISRAQIDTCTSLSLSELLTKQAGLQMSLSGGAGRLSSVFVRGAEARHTVLLIDGVRYGSATAGGPNFDNISLDTIERIEVVKGPGSALYGSDGVGGVVQVFTRGPVATAKQGWVPTASATIGTYGRQQLGLGLRGAVGDLQLSLGAQNLKEDGFSATNAQAPFGNFNADADGFRQDSFTASASYQLHPSWALETRVMRAHGIVQFDDGLNRDTRTKNVTDVWSLQANGALRRDWQTSLQLAQSNDHSEGLVGAFLPSLFATRQTEIKWQNTVRTGLGDVIAGFDHRKQNATSSTLYDVSQRTINGVFVGVSGQGGAHSWQVNARRDSNSQFGKATTDYVAYGYELTKGWRISAASGGGFVAPSFNQLYFPRFGNPLLQPERSRNSELALRWAVGGHEIKLTHFDNKIRGFITNTTVAANIPRARIDGTSISYSGGVVGTGIRATWDQLNPRNELTGKQLPRRAKQQLNVALDRQTGAWIYGVNWLRVGERWDDPANSANRYMGAYATMDAHVGYVLNKDWNLQAQLVNLGDKAYETAYGYNSPGRSAHFTLRWTPR